MKTVTINKNALEKISNLVPELNQGNQSVNVNIEFYSFTDVVWTIQTLLDVANNMILDCSDGDEKRVLSASNNLIRMAKNLLPINSANFLDMLLEQVQGENTEEIKQQ